MFTKEDIGHGPKNENQAYRQQLIDRGYTFSACADLETFRNEYADVWPEVQDQVLAGKIVWDSERGGYWQAPNSIKTNEVWTAIMGAVGIGLVYAAVRAWTSPKQ